MTTKHLTDEEELEFWREASRRLLEATPPLPLSLDEAKRIVADLPPQEGEESLGDWIRRASQLSAKGPAPGRAEKPFAEIVLNGEGDGEVELKKLPEVLSGLRRFVIGVMEEVAGAFTPVTEVVPLTTTTDMTEPELPDPGRPLESVDGRFRVWAEEENGKIRITIEALGLAADEFANKRIGIVAVRQENDEAD